MLRVYHGIPNFQAHTHIYIVIYIQISIFKRPKFGDFEHHHWDSTIQKTEISAESRNRIGGESHGERIVH